MDELLNHCLREIAFDGNLGCNSSRLKDFIVDFYAHNESHPQTLDDSFLSFVWSLVAEHPTVLIGLKDPKMKSEVWIAPQNIDKRKAKAHGGDKSAERSATLQPIPEPKSTPLDTLQSTYGNKLRIALEPDAIVAAITGSHIRSPKITDLVYTVLQFIARGRDAGVGVLELGKLSGYDPKTCFYLVKILTELDIVSKVRRGGVGTHLCIHNYFFKRNASWKAIRDEETHAETSTTVSNAVKVDPSENLVDDEPQQDLLKFTPIDGRHLSSLPLISARVIRLLKASRNNMHQSHNMLITLGFTNPTKTDRRFFQTRVREMIQQGIIEKVIVPSNRKNTHTNVKCLRLVKHDSGVQDDEEAEALEDAEGALDTCTQRRGESSKASNGLLVNVTIHKQIIDLVENSGTAGMTLNELSASLCHLDKRTIELFLERAEKSEAGVPPHLNDLSITSIKETSGREHRNRYFTVANLKQLVESENLSQNLDTSSARYDGVDLEDTRGFYPFQEEQFYASVSEMQQFGNSFRMSVIGRPRKVNKRPPINPILPNGQVKRGRPRKHPIIVTPEVSNAEEAGPSKGRKRKRKASESVESSPPPPPSPEPRQESPCPSEPIEINGTPVRRSKRQKIKANGKLAPPSTPSVSAPPISARTRRKANSSSQLLDISVSQPKEPDASDAVAAPCRERERSVDMDVDDVPQAELPPEGPEEVQQVSTDKPPVEQEITEAPATIPLKDTVAPVPPPPEDDGGDGPEPASGPNDITPAVIATPESPSPMVSRTATMRSPNGPKTSSSAGPSRVNVSHLRRENELLRIVQDFGGILNMQTKDLYDAHLNLLEELTRAGEPTSAPAGSKIDKRTVVSTFNNLETKGRVKQLKTTLTSTTGLKRPACIIHLPEVEQSKLNAFLADLARASHIPSSASLSNVVKIDTQVDYGPGAPSTSKKVLALPLQLLRMEEGDRDGKNGRSTNEVRAKQLFAYDDSIIRDVLLAERSTLAQAYGFIVGKALRSRQFHLAAIDALTSNVQSENIISKKRRIIDLTFFCQDLAVDTYCSLITPLSYSEELAATLETEQGRKTLVHDLPPSLQALLHVGRSRPRTRFLEMLDMLRSLGLVTPLLPSTSEEPAIVCDDREDHMSFDIAPPDGWTPNTSTIAPMHWQINEETSIYYWCVADSTPPFWKNARVSTHAECVAYWADLRYACADGTATSTSDGPSPVRPECASVGTARSLRRSASWKREYSLTWHQEQYLKQFIGVVDASTPLQIVDDRERQRRLDGLRWVTSAPQDAIERFFIVARHKLEKSILRQKRKAKRNPKPDSETKRLLAKKAEEARAQREEEWANLIAQVHPDPFPDHAQLRVDRVRRQFLQSASTKDVGRWERGIEAALHEAELAGSKGLMISLKHPAVPRPHHAPGAAAVSSHVASVRELIEIQGPPLEVSKPTTKRKRKNDPDRPADKVKKPRRHRFQWNPDFDELARDASAIIRARCRNLSRLDWAAFEQVFPSVPRNTVRQRLSHIKEVPGNEAYLRRLEDAWYDLWLLNKGSPELPDENEESPSDFDLVKHVEFLRENIDKDALRVGIAQTTETSRSVLPSSVYHLSECYDVAQEERPYPEWDYMWNTLIEEGREKKLKRHCLTRFPEKVPPSRISDPEDIALVESILKMTMGTPPELYDPERGAALFKGIDPDAINTSTKNLLTRGVLSKSQRDPQKQKPGRQLKISEVNQNAISGIVTRDTFQDAVSLLDEIDSSDHSWHDWPLTATDGDCATLIELVSENKVDLNIDTSLAQAARPALDWNSKKTDDDQIETAISVRYRLDPETSDAPHEDLHILNGNIDFEEEAPMIPPGHGLNIDNAPACCKITTAGEGLVDCSACLDHARTTALASFDPASRHVAECILEIINQAGKVGVKKQDISTQVNAEISLIAMIVTQMTQAEVPLMHWTGYDSLVLVSAHYMIKWSVVVSRDPLVSVFPRRWLDIRGKKVADFWQSALRAVMGVVIFRPGVPQTEIRWRLRNVYDRQEVIEVLHHLQMEGYLQLRVGFLPGGGIYAPFDDEEEPEVFWFIGEKHWYQV